MEEDTTTNAPVDDGGSQAIQGVPVNSEGQAVEESQPTDTDQAAAVAPATESTEQEANTAPSEPSEDDKLASWAEKKGLTLDSDNAKKAAKMAREAERAMHDKAQRASQLEKSMTEMSDVSAEQVAEGTGQNPEVLKRIQRIEVKDSIRDFWVKNPDAIKYEKDMARIATEAGLYGTPEAILKAAYAIAIAEDQGAVKSAGKREALQNLAQKQQASVPTGNATNSSSMGSEKLTQANVDRMVAQHDQAWFEKNYDAINKALAGQQ